MNSVIFRDNKKYIEYKYSSEDDFEKLIVKNSKLLFGTSTIYIDLKGKLDTVSLGSSKPDGLLFDISDIDNPEFYLVEVELEKHDFYKHIFPQITRFFAFFRNSKAHNGLLDKIFKLIHDDITLQKEFKSFLKEKGIYKFIKDTLENSQNILVIIDEMKQELLEMIDTYTEWDKMVKPLVLKEYRNGSDKIMILEPDFEDVTLVTVDDTKVTEDASGKIPRTEEFHLEGVDPVVKEVYYKIKDSLLSFKPSLRFNTQKYYISIVDKWNFAYLSFRKKKIWIVVMLNEDEIRNAIKFHKIVSKTPGVQKFYGGECAAIEVENSTHLNEIIDLLKTATPKS